MRALQANIQRLLTSRDWTQERLAEEIGTSQPTINRWLKEKNFPRQNQIKNLAALAGMSEGDFVYGSGRFIKLVDWVAASAFASTTDPYDSSDPDAPTILAAGLKHDDFIALKIDGPSMNRIAPEGSIIFVDLRQKELLPGRCYVFRDHDKATFKRYRDNPPRLEAVSTEQFDSIYPTGNPEVVGRAVKVVLDLKDHG